MYFSLSIPSINVILKDEEDEHPETSVKDEESNRSDGGREKDEEA